SPRRSRRRPSLRAFAWPARRTYRRPRAIGTWSVSSADRGRCRGAGGGRRSGRARCGCRSTAPPPASTARMARHARSGPVQSASRGGGRSVRSFPADGSSAGHTARAPRSPSRRAREWGSWPRAGAPGAARLPGRGRRSSARRSQGPACRPPSAARSARRAAGPRARRTEAQAQSKNGRKHEVSGVPLIAPYADRMAGRGGGGRGRAEWSALREWNDGGVAAVGAERPSANRHVAQPPARLFDLGRQEALGLLVDAEDVADQVAGTVLVDGVELLLDCFGFGEQPLALLEQPVEAIQVVGGDGVALRQRGAADRLVQANAERDWPDLGRWRVELLDQGGTPL